MILTIELAHTWHGPIIQHAQNLYDPLALEVFQRPLSIAIIPGPSIAASAAHEQDKLVIAIQNRLFTSPRLTPDSLRILLCHELGHFFAGAPRTSPPPYWDRFLAFDGDTYYSSEGQADYYATAVCFRRLIEYNHPMDRPHLAPRPSPLLSARCRKGETSKQDYLTCLRAAHASKDFLRLVYDFDISLERFSTVEVEQTLRNIYPDRQCRLDTFIRGAACSTPLPLVFDFSIDSINECPHSPRPACWYRGE